MGRHAFNLDNVPLTNSIFVRRNILKLTFHIYCITCNVRCHFNFGDFGTNIFYVTPKILFLDSQEISDMVEKKSKNGR